MTINAHTLRTTTQDGTTLLSHVVYPTNAQNLPTILVAPEWWGAEDTHPRCVSEKLAELGFVAVTMDVYGDGKLTTDAACANAWMTQVLQDPSELMDRCWRIYRDVADLVQADSERIGAIGYCFGGKIVLDMARLAHTTNTPLKAAATFHGNPTPITPADSNFSTAVLVAHGGADSMIPMSAINSLEAELQGVSATYTIDIYPNAKHGFSNPMADKRAADNGVDLGYDVQASQDSFDKMVCFMQQHL